MSGRRIVAGQVWRMDTGGKPLYLTAVDERFAYTKRADSPKRELSRVAGSGIAALSEFETWTLLEDPDAIEAVLHAATLDGEEIDFWKVPADLGDGDAEVEVVYTNEEVRVYRTRKGVPERIS